MTQRHHKSALLALALGGLPTLGIGGPAADVQLALQPPPGEGRVYAALYAVSDENWGKPLQAVDGTADTLRFSAVPPGRYAVQAFVDLDGNQQLKISRRGIPQEPVGFSGAPAALRRKPTPEQVAFEHGEQASQVVIHLRLPSAPREPGR